MLEQYFVQYDLVGCCLRAPWIMEKDDFKYSLSFGEDVFGGPNWQRLSSVPKNADEYAGAQRRSVDARSRRQTRENAISSNISDLVESMTSSLSITLKAHQQTFNICMDEPVDYLQVVATHLREGTRHVRRRNQNPLLLNLAR